MADVLRTIGLSKRYPIGRVTVYALREEILSLIAELEL